MTKARDRSTITGPAWLSFRVEPDFKKQINAHCAARGISLQDWASPILKRQMEAEQKKESKRK